MVGHGVPGVAPGLRPLTVNQRLKALEAAITELAKMAALQDQMISLLAQHTGLISEDDLLQDDAESEPDTDSNEDDDQ